MHEENENFKIIKSNRGKDNLLFEGIKYRCVRTPKYGIVWRCSLFKDCGAICVTDHEKTTITEVRGKHDHGTVNTKSIQMQEIRTAVKRKAAEELHIQPKKILRQVLSEVSDNVTFSDVQPLTLAAYRARQKIKPTVPKNIDDVLSQLSLFVPKAEDKGLKVYSDQASKIVGVSFPENMHFLTRYNENILADGTFKYAPKHFMQTYTIHVFKNGLNVHVATFFLPSKTEETYISMWQLLKKMSLDMSQIELTIHEIMLDFEVAAHNAARKVFCDVRITACKFHLGQSWYRRITKSKFLYIAYNYKGDENIVLVEIRNWLKLFFSLSYLKPEHVIDAFLHLEATAPNHPCCHKFVLYISKNYIYSNTFPPSLWASVFTRNCITTTNAVENYNGKLDYEFYHSHPNVYEAIDQITNAQTIISLKINSINQNETFKKRKQQSDEEEIIISLTDALYTFGYITPVQFLHELVQIRHPPTASVDPVGTDEEDDPDTQL